MINKCNASESNRSNDYSDLPNVAFVWMWVIYSRVGVPNLFQKMSRSFRDHYVEGRKSRLRIPLGLL